ncbi:MAG: hypothetical protein ACOZE5_04510 [Verrucomicrobiota bacterium]
MPARDAEDQPAKQLALFPAHWSPKIVAELNGQQVKRIKIRGGFVWRHPAHEDELFLVLRGSFRMEWQEPVRGLPRKSKEVLGRRHPGGGRTVARPPGLDLNPENAGGHRAHGGQPEKPGGSAKMALPHDLHLGGERLMIACGSGKGFSVNSVLNSTAEFGLNPVCGTGQGRRATGTSLDTASARVATS